MPDLVLDYHRLKVPLDHLDRSIPPSKLDVEVFNRTFAWWVMSSGYDVVHHENPNSDHTYSLMNRVRTDLAYVTVARDGMRMPIRSQYPTWNSLYTHEMITGAATSDHLLVRWVTGTSTRIGYEAVDLSDYHYLYGISVAGSTFKCYRDRGVVKDLLTLTPKFTVTDTTFASGYYGIGFVMTTRNPYLLLTLYLPPASQGARAQAILEVGVASSDQGEHRFAPDLASELVKTGDGQVIDLLAVTNGAFEFSEKSPTNIVMVYDGNPYRSDAIERQKKHAEKKGLRALAPPKDYGEAVKQFNALRGGFPHWLAGKDSYAYQALGWEELELFAVADFYYGELIEHKTHYDQLKRVPDWELRSVLTMWMERLEKVKALVEERDKHLKKLEEIMKLGW